MEYALMGEPPGWFAAESPSRGVLAACSTDTLRSVHRRHFDTVRGKVRDDGLVRNKAVTSASA